METETTIYHELPGDFTHPSPPSSFPPSAVLQPTTHLNFSRPRPPLLPRNNLGNATYPELKPSALHIPEAKRISKGDSCIAFSPDTENTHMSDDDDEAIDNAQDIDIDFGDVDDTDYDEAVPPPISRTNDRCLPSSPAIPPSVMRWREPHAESASEYDMSDASSMLTTDTDMTATTMDTVTADNASVKTVDSAAFSFDGRLGWTPRKLSHAEQERQRCAYPTPKRQAGSNDLLPFQISPSKSPQAEAKPAGKRNLLTKRRRPSPVQTHLQAEQNPQLPTPPLIMKHTTFEQHTDAIEPVPAAAAAAAAAGPNTPSKHISAPFSEPSSAVSEGHSEQSGSKTNSIGSFNSGPPSNTSSGEWRSSEHDVAGLSEAQIKKLKRKGINPALYAEMQSARRAGPNGKKSLIGPLTGNSFLS